VGLVSDLPAAGRMRVVMMSQTVDVFTAGPSNRYVAHPTETGPHSCPETRKR
jgi:hypothetical protein